jgi:hypothetical protein
MNDSGTWKNALKRRAMKVLALGVAIGFLAPVGAAFAATTATQQSTAGTIALPSSASNPAYGVLMADPNMARMDYTAGARLAIVPLQWSLWEPSSGTFSAAYQAQEIGVVNKFIQQGFTVGINMDLNEAPGCQQSVG